jgi:hypothetical protein
MLTPFKRALLLSKPQFRRDRDLTEVVISSLRRRLDKKLDTNTDSKPLFHRDPEPPKQTRLRRLIERSTP